MGWGRGDCAKGWGVISHMPRFLEVPKCSSSSSSPSSFSMCGCSVCEGQCLDSAQVLHDRTNTDSRKTQNGRCIHRELKMVGMRTNTFCRLHANIFPNLFQDETPTFPQGFGCRTVSHRLNDRQMGRQTWTLDKTWCSFKELYRLHYTCLTPYCMLPCKAEVVELFLLWNADDKFDGRPPHPCKDWAVIRLFY